MPLDDEMPMLENDPEEAYESKTPLSTLVEWFEDSEEATDAARRAAERDRDYYDGKQLTSKEIAALRKRGQPDIIINRIKPKIDYLMGHEAMQRTDPRAYPRTPQDEDASEAATDALRYVTDKNEAGLKFSRVWENMLIEGYGGIEVVIEQPANGQGDPDIVIQEWDWDRLFYDHHSRKLDFSDARYVGGVIWMDAEDAKAKWPSDENIQAIESTLSEAAMSQTYEDRPRSQQWVTGRSRKRVRIVQMYYREGNQWWQCIFTKGGKLESTPVPFVDQDGMSWCPMLLQSAYVDRDNNRYGLVRTMIGVQDEINKRRSKALHRLTMRQVRMDRGAVDDEDKARLELAKPDGLIITNPGLTFEVLDSNREISAELAMQQEAKNEIELMGPNPALLGTDKDAPSGRAIAMNKQSGQTEITMLMDRHRWLKKRTHQAVWNLVRQYKKGEWWVRVTDNEDNVKFVGLNRPVTMREEITKRLQKKGGPPEMVQQFVAQMEQGQNGAMLDQPVRVENQPTEMWMDITLEEVPDVASSAEEQFQALVKLAPAVTFPPEIYLQASSLRNKRELIEKLKTAQGPPPDPVEMEAKKIALEQAVKKTEAEIENILSQALLARAKADATAMPMGVVTDPGLPSDPNQPGAPAAPQPMPPPAEQPMAPPSVSVPPPGNGREEMPPPGLTGV